MKWWERLYEPSTLIFFALVIFGIIFAYVATTNPNANESFFETCSNAIKLLCGALAGAFAGEKFGKKE